MRGAWLLVLGIAACHASTASAPTDAGHSKKDSSTAECVPGEIEPDPTPMGCEGCAIAVSLTGVVLEAGVVACAADGGTWAGRYEYADGCMCGSHDASRADATPGDGGEGTDEGADASDDGPPVDASSGGDGSGGGG